MNQIATTILNQLGREKFIAMTGAKSFLYDENSLTMKIGKNYNGITHCKIQLTPSDTYTITFYKIKPRKTETTTCSDICAEMLKDTFTQNTGLCTSL